MSGYHMKEEKDVKMEDSDEICITLEDFKQTGKRPGRSANDTDSTRQKLAQGLSGHRDTHVSSSHRETELPKELHDKDQMISMLREQVRRLKQEQVRLRPPAHQGPTKEDYKRQKDQIRSLQDQLFQSQVELDQEFERLSDYRDLEDEHEKALVKIEQLEKQTEEMLKANRINMTNFRNHTTHLKGQIKSLKNQLIAQEAAKAKRQTIANAGKVSDDSIKGIWKKMAYNIENMAATLLTGKPSMKELKHAHEEKLCAICHMEPEHHMLLQHDDYNPLVVELYIWKAVVRKIFSCDETGSFGTSWAGNAGRSMCVIYNKLLDHKEVNAHATEIMQWKSESACIIDRLIGVQTDELQDAIFDEFEGLRKLLPNEHGTDENAEGQLFKGIQTVFEDALELQRIFLKSRAHFEIDWANVPEPGNDYVHYNPEYHNAEVYEKKPDETSIVLFTFAPSLMKAGNADGDSYDKFTRLVKASVICN